VVTITSKKVMTREVQKVNIIVATPKAEERVPKVPEITQKILTHTHILIVVIRKIQNLVKVIKVKVIGIKITQMMIKKVINQKKEKVEKM
jgi:hypothetical protein